MYTAALFAAPALLTVLTSASNPTCPFQCVPGVEKLGAGVDLTWFTPQVQGQLNPAAIKQPVVKLSSLEQYQWTNPYDNQTWGVWDQVQSLETISESVTDSADYSFRDYFTFSEHYDVSVETSAFFGLYTSGYEFHEFWEFGLQFNATMEHVSGTVDAYIGSLYQTQYLSADGKFLEQVNELPTEWWTPVGYHQWTAHFDTFGTHFIRTMRAGGNFYYYSYCTSAYIYEYGSEKAAEEAKKDFMWLLSVDGAIQKGVEKANEAYLNGSTRTVECNGGNGFCNDGDPAVYSAWVDSVHSNPWLLEMTYVANSDLLSGPTKMLYEEVTIAYAAWAGLDVLSKLCHLAENKYQSLIDKFLSQNNGPQNHPGGEWDYNYRCIPSPANDHPNCVTYLGPKMNTYEAWRIGHANAKEYLYNTTRLCSQIDSLLNQKQTDARVTSWLGNTVQLAEEVNDYLTRAFSYPMEYQSRVSVEDTGNNCCCESYPSSSLPACPSNYCARRYGPCVSQVYVPVGVLTPPDSAN